MKNQPHLKVVKVRGYLGIYKVLLWSEEKKDYVDPRGLRESKQKTYRAVRRIKRLGISKQEAKFFETIEEANAWRKEVAKEEDTKVSLSQGYRFKHLLQDWREWSKPPRLKKTTWDIYSKDVKHFQPLYEIPVDDLSAHNIDEWLKICMDPRYPKKCSRVSFAREVTTLTTVLGWYREYKNSRYQIPVLKRHRRDCFFKEKGPKPWLALSVEDLERFLERIKNHHRSLYYYLASFQALTGTRIGEVCGLEWSAVDFNQRTVNIRKICAWDYFTGHPVLREGTKTGETREIVLPDRLYELLQEWKKQNSGETLVFHQEGHLLRYNAVQSVYKKAFRALGLPMRSTHVLRHSFATIYAEQTQNLRAAQSALGHRDLRITQHYAKVALETQRKALSSFALGRSETKEPTPPPQNGEAKILTFRRK